MQQIGNTGQVRLLALSPTAVFKGKSMLAKNVAHQALVQGYTVRFTTAGEMLGELAAMDSDAALRRRLRCYVNPDLLVIDEIGYLPYSNRPADLLFELVNRRYESKSTIVTTSQISALLYSC